MSDETLEAQAASLEAVASNVAQFTGRPYRVTAESVIRHMLSQIDKVQECVIVFRLKDKPTLLMNYSTEISAVDLAIGGLTLTSLAEQKMGLVAPTDLKYEPLPE